MVASCTCASPIRLRTCQVQITGSTPKGTASQLFLSFWSCLRPFFRFVLHWDTAIWEDIVQQLMSPTSYVSTYNQCLPFNILLWYIPLLTFTVLAVCSLGANGVTLVATATFVRLECIDFVLRSRLLPQSSLTEQIAGWRCARRWSRSRFLLSKALNLIFASYNL